MWFFGVFLALTAAASAKEIALTFDDAPGEDTGIFKVEERTDELIRKLKLLDVPQAIFFANPCNGGRRKMILRQLAKFRNSGNLIGNHTCTHPRLDKVGFERFALDVDKADALLESLIQGQKVFRFPFFNEGSDKLTRDQVRNWLKSRGYKNIPSSVENEDPVFSLKLNQAKAAGKKIDYIKVETLFVDHVLAGAEFYEKLAREVLGYSPKHILLLHDKDATVLFLESLIRALRKNGWTIIGAQEAIRDPLYSLEPQNTHAEYGLLAQVAFEKSGAFAPYYDFEKLKRELNAVLGLTN